MNTVIKWSKSRKLFRTWLDWFAASFLGFFFSIMTLGFYTYKAILICIIIAHLLFFFGMMYTGGQRTAKYDRLKVSGVTEFSRKWALLLSLFANLIPIITTLLQLVLQMCGITGFLPVYKLININFVPLLYAIESTSENTTLSVVSYIAVFAVCIVSIAVVYITYSLVYKDVDVKAILMYENKK